jgi:RNA polymerase sigma-70 factor, ECF subfamily
VLVGDGGTLGRLVPSPLQMSSTADASRALPDRTPLPYPGLAKRLRYARVAPSNEFDGSTMAADAQEPAAVPALPQGRAQFEAAVRPHFGRLYRFCLALTGSADRADDLFQNTLIKAYLNAASFEGRSDLVVWICGIARHEYLEMRRTEARRRGIFDRFVDACASALGFDAEAHAEKSPEASVMRNEHSSLLMSCLQQLPEDFRVVVVLCDIEELGYDRVAEILGIPKGTVKSRHARGRVRLREVYQNVIMVRDAEPAAEKGPS